MITVFISLVKSRNTKGGFKKGMSQASQDVFEIYKRYKGSVQKFGCKYWFLVRIRISHPAINGNITKAYKFKNDPLKLTHPLKNLFTKGTSLTLLAEHSNLFYWYKYQHSYHRIALILNIGNWSWTHVTCACLKLGLEVIVSFRAFSLPFLYLLLHLGSIYLILHVLGNL